MSSEIDLSRLSEEEITRLMKSLNNRQLYKDPTSLTPDSITNCLCIQPFKTLTSHNYFIKRNLLYISETEEYIYSSGHNIIVEKISNKTQEIIPLTHRCFITSLTYVKTSSGKRMLFIGEKLYPDESKKIHGGIEIINLEDKNCNKKLSLNMGAYVNYNNYVYDIIAKDNNDVLIIILKNLDMNANEVKLFFYNFINFNLITIEDIKYNLINIEISPHNNNQYLLTANNYCAIYDFYMNKLQLILSQQFYANNKDNILCSSYLRVKNKKAIVIYFKGEYFEIFMKKEGKDEKYKIFFRIDLSLLFNEDISKIKNSEEDNDQKDSESIESDVDNGLPLLDNFIIPESNEFRANFEKKNSSNINLNKDDNYVKFIICRKNFIFIFKYNDFNQWGIRR